MNLNLCHKYLDLGNAFSQQSLPAKVKSPKLLLWNDELAKQMNLDVPDQFKANYFSGTQLIPGSEPTSMTYAGHQFGHFNPQLGDGRAHLLGEFIDPKQGIHEIHLKGSGQTPYSRNGDGKCGIKPAVREYIMSEAMYALGIPTTRSLAVVSTGEYLMRQQATTGAVVTRVADSHIRVGTFEYFAARGMQTEIKVLADLVIDRHHQNIEKNKPNTYFKLLSEVIDKQIYLLTQWMRVGFIHGVLNTDNTLLSGETIDYGPCAMMGVYDPATVFSSIDHNGRYAFGNQPAIIQWNMTRLAECLLPLIDPDEQSAITTVTELLNDFSSKYNQSYHQMMGQKLGFDVMAPESLITDLLASMHKNQLDYTQTFDSLSKAIERIDSIDLSLKDWRTDWLKSLKNKGINVVTAQSLMSKSNPKVIPRNHHIEQVLLTTESTLNKKAATEILTVLKSPYEVVADTHKYQDSNASSDLNYQTYCGT